MIFKIIGKIQITQNISPLTITAIKVYSEMEIKVPKWFVLFKRYNNDTKGFGPDLFMKINHFNYTTNDNKKFPVHRVPKALFHWRNKSNHCNFILNGK